MKKERDLPFYLEKAKENAGIPSDRKLGIALGRSDALINQMRRGRAFPSDDVMIQLATLAGIDPYIALIDLNSWRSEGAARTAYKEILKRISVIIILVSVCVSPLAAQASVNKEQCYYGKDTVYYGKYYTGFLKRGFVKVFQWLQTILSHGPLIRQSTFAA